MGNKEKYYMACLSQRLKRTKETMFYADPGSVEHTQAVIKYDKIRMELKSAQRMLAPGPAWLDYR